MEGYRTLDEFIGRVSPERQRKIYAEAARLIAEEMTLRELRRARKLTQAKLAKKLKLPQNSVSDIERRTDLLLSTLRKTVSALGGNLTLVAEFPDRAPVKLTGLSDIGEEGAPPRKKRKAA